MWKKERGANGEGEKRKREVLEVDDDTTEDELDDVMSWPPTARGEVETPSKRQKVEEVTPVATTKRKLPWLNYDEGEVKTPSKSPGNGLPTPSLTKTNGQDPSTSPMTGRFRDAMRSPPAEGAGSMAGQTLSMEVFDLLEKNGVSLGEKAQGDLRAALARHEMKLQGVIKGRDLVRTALKGKEARIAELQGRIAGIEAEREVLRGALSRLKGPEV
ncbi:hypothetical protein BDZ85DRAFT_256350 [Elsinoe ampelina]|uniref:Uncharacterized protein n=1 Tax=Elsinoe ampelina TaxID=302913 RepID=A0A6A6GLE1_9PEZI|nr:hypothetical protein BDZ85DRAFT_256350 [Elsinoe ampelina]